MKHRLINTSAARITKVYAALLLGITIILSIVIMTVVGYRQFQVQRQQALGIVHGLQRSYIANRDDWYWWRLGSPMDTKNDFVRIKVNHYNRRPRYLYSPNTKKFTTHRPTDEVHFTKRLVYSNENGWYYHVRETDKTPSEKISSVQYDVWMKLDGMADFLLLLLKLIIGIILSFLVIGTWVIYLLARRLNQPLVTLTQATQKINDDISHQYHQQLPVPNSPQEVHDLSREFNQLLKSLSDQALADQQFVSNASHELKTPIATIRGHVSLIKRRGQQHPEVIPTSLKFIDEESERMQRLVTSLLKLSHANRLEVLGTEVDLSRLVKDVADRYQTAMAQKLAIHVQRNVFALVNLDSIEQVIVSLLNNAQKYSPASSTIELRLEAVGDEVTLLVIDTGKGIPDEQKPHIFERFYRGKDVAGTAGNGLGLAIVKQLIDVNHGTIKVVDNQPRGSIFKINLPRKVISNNG